MFSLSSYHVKVKPVDTSRAGNTTEKSHSELPLLPILICFHIQTAVSWVQPMSLQWDFLLYGEVANLESGDSHPVVTAVDQTKKRTNRMRSSAYLRVVNTTSLLKPSVKQLTSEEKFTKQECGGTQSCCFFLSFFHLARIKYFVFLFYVH